MAGQLPQGFTLDKQKDLPSGFTLDGESPPVRNNLVSDIMSNQPASVQGLEARGKRQAVRESLAAARPSNIKNALGPIDAGLTIASGSVAQAAGGTAGLLKLAYEAGVNGNPNALQEAIDLSQKITEKGTIGPLSESGQDVLEVAGKAIEPLTTASQGAGNAIVDASIGTPLESLAPALATAAQITVEGAPSAFGVGTGVVRSAARRGDIANVESGATRSGIDLGADPITRNQQIAETGNTFTRGQSEAATSIAPVAESLVIRERAAQTKVNELYTTARAEGAESAVRGGVVEDALSGIVTEMEAFPLDSMAHANGRVKALETILKNSGAEGVSINKLETWRQSLGRSYVDGDPSQNAAIKRMTQIYDDTITDVFVSDMISGSPKAIDKWSAAIAESRDVFNRFSSDDIMRRLQREAITPVEVKRLIIGQNSINAPGPAVRTIAKLKEVFGESSQEWGAIRAEMAFDVFRPLLNESPNFNQFIRNYDNLIQNNGRLAREVFGEEIIADVKNIRDITSSVRDNASSGLGLDPLPMMARMVWGNSLARNAAKLKAIIGLGEFSVKRGFGGSERSQIISGVLGYDVSKSVFDFRATGLPAGAVQTLSEESEEQQQ